MIYSVDSLSLVNSYPKLSKDYLAELGFSRKKGKFGSWTWFDNGLSEIYEPQLTFYRTWNRVFRLRVDINPAKILYGTNINLASIEEIRETLDLTTNNIKQRTGLNFDTFKAQTTRIHYAFNQTYSVGEVSQVIAYYANKKKIPRLEKNVIKDQTVYLENNSRGIRIYDKQAEILNENPIPKLIEQSSGIVRYEYYINGLTPVKRFAKRLGFKDNTAEEMLSESNINTAINEFVGILGLENLDLSNESQIAKIFQQTGDMNTAIRLSGFGNALKAFGEEFYKNDIYGMSKSTYYRLLRECQKLGV